MAESYKKMFKCDKIKKNMYILYTRDYIIFKNL